MVRTYSLKADGNKQLSPHFKVREFRCNDGSDKILISDELVEVLEKIRTHFNKPVIITSGYRTESYNRICGGAKESQHLYGTAADIKINGVDPLKICRYAETLMPNSGGIGYYVDRFAHVDVRAKRARWKQISSGQPNISVSGFGLPVLKKGSKGEDVKELQKILNKFGYNLVVDGIFGTNTETAVLSFQKLKGLLVDGIVGPKTWAALEG